jgi:hypothetical protein
LRSNGTNTTLSQVNVATDVTGTLPVANGGTGASTLTSANVILGAGTSAVTFVAPGSNGNVLTSNGSTWTSAAPPAGGVTSLNGQTGAITNTDYGVIGSYTVAGINTYTQSAEFAPDTTVAGNTLTRSTSTVNWTGLNGSVVFGSGESTSLSLSGTWRRLTRARNPQNFAGTSTALFVRIS